MKFVGGKLMDARFGGGADIGIGGGGDENIAPGSTSFPATAAAAAADDPIPAKLFKRSCSDSVRLSSSSYEPTAKPLLGPPKSGALR